jgi:methyltransferase (TIGR00027 family)
VQEGQSSRTAEYVALFRALETQRPVGQRLFADPLASAFLTRPLAAVAALARTPGIGALVPWAIDRRVPGPLPSAVARTKVLDEAVEAALAAGTEQLVILGAGYDSRAYRLAGAGRIPVFEVDHPDTQAVKQRIVGDVLGGLPAHVRFVPVDFDHDDLAAALERAGLVVGRRTFVLWEGVASYLTPETARSTSRTPTRGLRRWRRRASRSCSALIRLSWPVTWPSAAGSSSTTCPPRRPSPATAALLAECPRSTASLWRGSPRERLRITDLQRTQQIGDSRPCAPDHSDDGLAQDGPQFRHLDLPSGITT